MGLPEKRCGNCLEYRGGRPKWASEEDWIRTYGRCVKDGVKVGKVQPVHANYRACEDWKDDRTEA
jgi:hypothetical protein